MFRSTLTPSESDAVGACARKGLASAVVSAVAKVTAQSELVFISTSIAMGLNTIHLPMRNLPQSSICSEPERSTNSKTRSVTKAERWNAVKLCSHLRRTSARRDGLQKNLLSPCPIQEPALYFWTRHGVLPETAAEIKPVEPESG
jgi:hypothetical protein